MTEGRKLTMGQVWVKAAGVDRLLRADRIHEIEIEDGRVRATSGTVSYMLSPATGPRRPSPRSIEDLIIAIANAESDGKPCIIAAGPIPEEAAVDTDAAEVDVTWETTDLHQVHMRRVYADADPPVAFPPPYRPSEHGAV